MNIAALERPKYVQLAHKYSQMERENHELDKFLRTPKGREAYVCGQNAITWKRVIVKVDNRFFVKHLPRKAHECTYPEGSFQAIAWEEGYGRELESQRYLYEY